jgi:hypothetical protein
MRPSNVWQKVKQLERDRLKADYLDTERHRVLPPNTPEPEPVLEEIVVDAGKPEYDPYNLRADIAWTHPSGIHPEIEHEAVARMNELSRERDAKIEALRDRGDGRVGPLIPGQYFSHTSSGVTIENPEANRRAWAKRSRNKLEEEPYALPGENFEQAAKRHLGLDKPEILLDQDGKRIQPTDPWGREPSDPDYNINPVPEHREAPTPATELQLSYVDRLTAALPSWPTRKRRTHSEVAKSQRRDSAGRFS